MNVNIRTIVAAIAVIVLIIGASAVVMAKGKVTNDVSNSVVSNSITITNPAFPYVTVCCMQNNFWSPDGNFGLPVVVTVYDKNMNPVSGYDVTAILTFFSDGAPDITDYRTTKKTGSTGIVKFGIQLPAEQSLQTGNTVCVGSYSSCTGPGMFGTGPSFRLDILVTKGTQHYVYMKDFTITVD